MYGQILINNDKYNHGSFAFCRSCYWMATILSKIESYECPLCPSQMVDLKPLNLNEKYEYKLKPNKNWYPGENLTFYQK